MTVHVNESVSVVAYKLIELNKTCMNTILKALSIVMNENGGNKLFTVIKQLKMEEYSKDTYFYLNYSFILAFLMLLTDS